jgi:ABC-type nitrate/sulfonate/bicarbonate transport system substrate-binding protein
MKRLTMTCLVSVVCLVSSIAFAQEGSNEGPVFAKTKPIRIAVEFTTHSACAHIANQKGWYKKEGLTVSSYENLLLVWPSLPLWQEVILMPLISV